MPSLKAWLMSVWKAFIYRTKQHCCIAFDGTVRIDLDEHPIRPTGHRNSGTHPGDEPVQRGQMRVRAVDGSVFEPGKHLPDPAAHVERERSLNDQKTVRRGLCTYANWNAVPMRSRSRGIIDGVIDAIYRSSLRRIGCCGQCEIGVASRFEQNSDLVVDAAPSAVRASIVESPVAVNEAERDSAVGSSP